jgi:hypothetical protein
VGFHRGVLLLGPELYLTAAKATRQTVTNGYAAKTPLNRGVGRQIALNCSGELNQGSFLIDYTFNKHFDIYAGVTMSDIGGGLPSGFLQTDDVGVASGSSGKSEY